MTYPSRPAGYDVAYHVPVGNQNIHLTVGFDRDGGYIPRFLATFHYMTSRDPVEWTPIARMDHNETPGQGHDVYREGLHVDVARRSKTSVHLDVRHGPLPASRGTVLRGCIRYFQQEAGYIIDVYEENHPPGSPPRWSSDGGELTRTFISADPLNGDMSREAPAEDEVLTPEELSEVLAEATNTTAEEIERGAAELEIAPLEEATVVGYGGRGPLTEPDDED